MRGENDGDPLGLTGARGRGGGGGAAGDAAGGAAGERPTSSPWNFFWVCWWSVLLGAQQSCVMMPLTAVTVGPYCVAEELPIPMRAMVCAHKWASIGCLLGGGLLLVGAPLVWWACTNWFDAIRLQQDNGGRRNCLVGFLADAWFWYRMLIGVTLSLPGLVFFLGWAVGGTAVGVFVTLTSLAPARDMAMVKMGMGPCIFLCVAAGELLAEALRTRVPCLKWVFEEKN